MIALNEFIRIFSFIIRAFIHILPFFILSVILASAVSQLNFRAKISNFLSGKVSYAIVVASLFGALSPLCSCGVIPVIFALLNMGVPIAPVMSFWIASPLMSPEVFVVTWGNLGMEFALTRLFAAISMGLASGFISLALFRKQQSSTIWLKKSFAQDGAGCGCSGQVQSSAKLSFMTYLSSVKVKNFIKDMKKTAAVLSGWLAVAFFLEALIKFYFPAQAIKTLFGSQNAFSVIWAAAIGIPLYISNISAVPIVDALLGAGMSKGAALAFLLAGPVTTVPAMVAVYGLVKRKVFITFLLLAFSLPVVLGYLYELISLFY